MSTKSLTVETLYGIHADEPWSNWKFAVQLEHDSRIGYESLWGRLAALFKCDSIPLELKNFITKNNAAYPKNTSIMVNGKMQFVKQVLSFNSRSGSGYYRVSEDEFDVSFFDVMDSYWWNFDNRHVQAFKMRQFLPIAYGPENNLFCYSLSDRKMFYYDHSEDKFSDIGITFDEFVDVTYSFRVHDDEEIV